MKLPFIFEGERRKRATYYKIKIIIFVFLLLFHINICLAGVPVRVSFKFILDANGNRPVVGDINTDAEVNEQVEMGNYILANMISELQIDNLEIVDVAGIDQWFNVPVTGDNYNSLRNDAMANPGQYSWWDDAVNIYINGHSTGDWGGMASLPPDNDMIMIAQNCPFLTVIHELGHILNLYHTHDDDHCADTITDNASWNRDQIAQNNFSSPYSALMDAQKEQVDMVWLNVMSFHNPIPTRARFSHCQLNRMSNQGYKDKNWLYSKKPIYVDSSYTGLSHSGSFTSPYKFFQDVLNTRSITNKIIVFQEGSYTMQQDQISDAVELVTRFGSSTVRHPGGQLKPLYTLPVDLEKSKSAGVRRAIRAVKENEKKGRFGKARKNLTKAEKYAQDQEKIAVQLELAQRYRHSGKYKLAIKYYKLVAEGTKQKYLKKEALRLIKVCEGKQKKGKEMERGEEVIK